MPFLRVKVKYWESIYQESIMIIIKTTSVVILSALILTACSSSSRINPVVEDKIQAGAWWRGGSKTVFGTTALDASRRMIIYKLLDDNRKPVSRVCAEPPPDVGEEVRSALEAAINASIENDKVTQKFAIESAIKKELATKLKNISRPAGIQFERDMIASLCQMYLNEAIDAPQTRIFFNKVIDKSSDILLAEINASKFLQAALLEKEKKKGKTLTLTLNGFDKGNFIHKNKPLKVNGEGDILAAYNQAKIKVRLKTADPIRNSRTDLSSTTVIPYESGQNKYLITANIPGSLKDSNDNDLLVSGSIWEIYLEVQYSPNSGLKDYKVSSDIVYYDTDDEKSRISGEEMTQTLDIVTSGKDDGIAVYVDFPENHSVSYTGFNRENTVLNGKIELTDGTFIALKVITDLENTDGNKYKNIFGFKNDKDYKKYENDIKVGNLKLHVKYTTTASLLPELKDKVLNIKKHTPK
jgi:hypothetical protein